METCSMCGRDETEVKLLDGIYGSDVVKICEICAEIEDIPVIRRPSTSQLRESERGYDVRDRLRRMAGLYKEDEITKIARRITNVTLDDLRRRKQEKEKIEKLEQMSKSTRPLQLIDNFNWHVLMARKKRKLTRKELAGLLGESETAIKMIEDKQLPEDALVLISKLEQYFGIKLKAGETTLYSKQEGQRSMRKQEEQKVMGENTQKKEQKKEIRAKATDTKTAYEEAEEETEFESKANKNKSDKEPAVVLKFNKEITKNLTIADLQRMKEERKRAEREKRAEMERIAENEKTEKLRNKKEEIGAQDIIRQIEEEEREKEMKRQEKKDF